MEQKINEVFDRVIGAKRLVQTAAYAIKSQEMDARMENLDEWIQARNNDVRQAIIDRALANDQDYWSDRVQYENARDEYELAMLEVERLRVLIASARAGVMYDV